MGLKSFRIKIKYKNHKLRLLVLILASSILQKSSTIYTCIIMSTFIITFNNLLTFLSFILGLGWTLGMSICKFIHDRIGRRPTALIGCALVDGGLLLSYFTVQHSAIGISVTSGIMIGLGNGLVTTITMITAIEWTDKYYGIATASYGLAMSLGSMISNQLLTYYINPNNLKPDMLKNDTNIFSQTEILDRIPSFFLCMCCVSTVINCIGIIFLRTKEQSAAIITETTTIILKNSSSHEKKKLTKNDEPFSGVCQQNDADSGSNVWKDKSGYTFDIGMNERLAHSLNQDHTESEDILSSNSESNKGASSNNMIVDENRFPKEVLKQLSFYSLALKIFISDGTSIIVLTYYKSFGLNQITDDHFITNVGTFVIFTIGILSCVAGIVADFFDLRTTLITSASFLTMLSAFYIFTPKSKLAFAVATPLFAGMVYFQYMALRTLSLLLYGPKHFATIYGLANGCGCIVIVCLSPIIAFLLSYGWFYLFLYTSLINCISLILVIIDRTF